jgi:RNA polymerase sigma factor (TIGR02999 family)
VPNSDPPTTDRPDGEPLPDPPRTGSDTFIRQVYDELREIAHARLRGERAGVTLQSTELVHEAYMRLRVGDGRRWESRGQFFAAAAEAMRRILIDRARARGRQKRGGDADGRPARKLSLDLAEVAVLADDEDPDTVLALDRAIERLAEQDARVAEIVRLRFFAGLSVEEVAELLETSTRTVLRDWAFARAWLYGELTKG